MAAYLTSLVAYCPWLMAWRVAAMRRRLALVSAWLVSRCSTAGGGVGRTFALRLLYGHLSVWQVRSVTVACPAAQHPTKKHRILTDARLLCHLIPHPECMPPSSTAVYYSDVPNQASTLSQS
jgi:hypothetical protein